MIFGIGDMTAFRASRFRGVPRRGIGDPTGAVRRSDSAASGHAFTLLELLVAVTILMLVVGAVAGTFHAGLQSYRKTFSRGELLDEARGGLALMADDIGRMVLSDPQEAKFEASQLQFVLLSPDDAGGLAKVSYLCSPGALTRRLVGSRSGDEARARDVEIARGATAVSFEFLDNGQWVKSMAEPKFPRAVRVRLELQKGAEDALYRTVYLLPVDNRKTETTPEAAR